MGLSVCVPPIRLYLDVQVLESSGIPTQQFHGVFGKEADSEEAFHSLVVCPLYHISQRLLVLEKQELVVLFRPSILKDQSEVLNVPQGKTVL